MPKTRVIRVDPTRPEASAIEEARSVLAGGGLVAFPTETVYGLGGRALDPVAVGRIYEAKGRPGTHPLIAHVAGESEARTLVSAWSEDAARLVRTYWPGPLTLVVPRASTVPAVVAGGGPSIAIRAPAHPVARALLDALGEAVAAPSANRYQSLSPTRAEHVLKGLDGSVDLLLDGGACEAGIESTVVDLTSDPPELLRPGALSVDVLRRAIPRLVWRSAEDVPEHEARPSPGLDRRHYAPRTPVTVVPGREAAIARAFDRARQGARTALVCHSEPPGPLPPEVVVVALPRDANAYARELFAVLHDLDEKRVSEIVVEAVPEDESWAAVADRLRRASAS